MCDVTKENFEEKLPEILASIDRSNFVAFDAEFTGLYSSESPKNSLFDNGERRYRKLLLTSTQTIITQFGLSMFRLDAAKNEYSAESYNFYICPRSFASIDARFVCQSSSLEFLTRYGFDFNKFIYGGISYLNDSQERELSEDLRNGALFRAVDRNIPFQDEDRIRDICGDLAQWVTDKSDGAELEVDPGQVVPFVLHHEIRRMFPTLWTFSSTTTRGMLLVRLVTADKRKRLEQEEREKGDHLEKRLINSMLGFTKVVRHLSASGKPLVGHNCLLDTLKMYNQFLDHLPPSFKEFKKRFHDKFATVLDTKHIAYNVKRRFEKINRHFESAFQSSNLSQLYAVLSRPNTGYHLLFSPRIVHAEGFGQYEINDVPHEAGYDAFLAGFCFVKIAHLAATLSYLDANNMRPLSFREHLQVLSEYRNQVNVQRAVINHVNLAGDDPPTVRPTWIHVTARDGSQMDTTQVAEKFARYGCADIEPCGRSRALVAVTSHRGAKDILKSFRHDRDLLVENYNPLRHSPATRACLWAGVVVTTGLGLALLFSTRR